MSAHVFSPLKEQLGAAPGTEDHPPLEHCFHSLPVLSHHPSPNALRPLTQISGLESWAGSWFPTGAWGSHTPSDTTGGGTLRDPGRPAAACTSIYCDLRGIYFTESSRQSLEVCFFFSPNITDA